MGTARLNNPGMSEKPKLKDVVPNTDFPGAPDCREDHMSVYGQ